MLVKQDFINRIRDYFDLNEYEAKVWLALLGKGIASAGQIAEISRVPRSRTYDVLESLEKKGFVIIRLGKPVKYIGVKPNLVIEKLKNNIKAKAEEKILAISNLRNTEEFAKIEEIYREGLITPIKREDISAAIKGRVNISNHLKELLENSKEEVIICTSAEDIRSKINLFKETIEKLKKANIKTKVALFGEDNIIKKIGDNLNIKTKKIYIDTKFFIIDRRETLFYLSKDNNKRKEDTAIWINSEFFARAFAMLFDKAMAEREGGN